MILAVQATLFAALPALAPECLVDLLEFLAGWDLSDGMIDTIDTVEVDRHLSVVTEHRLTGVLLAAMRAGEVEVDRPEVVVEAHEWALTHARLLDTAML